MSASHERRTSVKHAKCNQWHCWLCEWAFNQMHHVVTTCTPGTSPNSADSLEQHDHRCAPSRIHIEECDLCPRTVSAKQVNDFRNKIHPERFQIHLLSSRQTWETGSDGAMLCSEWCNAMHYSVVSTQASNAVCAGLGMTPAGILRQQSSVQCWHLDP